MQTSEAGGVGKQQGLQATRESALQAAEECTIKSMAELPIARAEAEGNAALGSAGQQAEQQHGL